MRVSSSARIPVTPQAVARLAAAVLRAERARLAELSITFVGRTRIRTLNREHLSRDSETDVMAFALEGPLGTVGDVYCCAPVARRQARRHGTTWADELRRLVVHGVLHVLGYDHTDSEDRVSGPMWRLQERYLARYGGSRS